MLLGCLGIVFTLGKLDAMNQIRGWKPGGKIVSNIVTDKTMRPPKSYYLAWDDGDVDVPGNHCLNFSKSVWDSYSIGDAIEIVYLVNDPRPYHQQGIYASDGNFVFDYVVLAIEFAMVVVPLLAAIGIGLYFRRQDRRREARRTT